MAELVANCPRCTAASITFDISATVYIRQQHGWQNWFEAFGVCRNCHRSTVFVIAQEKTQWNDRTEMTAPEKYKGSLNDYFNVDGFINLADRARTAPPEHTPPAIAAIFVEAYLPLASCS
jgi:hypothetical protein